MVAKDSGRPEYVESYLYEKLDGSVKCKTCMHYCTLKDGTWGICRVRRNEGGRLLVYNYGLASSIALDPIEKKPLHNFRPGSKVLSFGGISCNFRCAHCQNYEISFADLKFPYIKEIGAEDVVRMCRERGADGVAFTYNEPSIWHEFSVDAGRLVKESGYYFVYVTNGYLSQEAVDQLTGVLDAANVDVKAFSEEFYRRICKARLDRVLECVEHLHRAGVFLELTYLIIPGENDDEKQLKAFSRWVAELDSRIPVHFSRFHPDYQMLDKSPTPIGTLEKAHSVAREEGLEYVYIGNVWGHRYESTYCPRCGELLIKRDGFYVTKINLDGVRCPKCSYRQNIII